LSGYEKESENAEFINISTFHSGPNAQKGLDKLRSFFGQWMMYDILTTCDEFALLMVWHMFFFLIFMGTRFVDSSTTDNIQTVEFQTEVVSTSILVNLNRVQILYSLLQSFSSGLAIILIRYFSEDEKNGYFFSSVGKLYEKFRKHLNNIVSETCKESEHEFSSFEILLLLFCIAVLDTVRIIFKESLYGDSDLYSVFWLTVLYGTVILVLSAKIIIKIVLETFYFNFDYPVRYILFLYFFIILGILGINYYISPDISITIFNEPMTIESRLGSALSLLSAKVVFLYLVFDFVAYKESQSEKYKDSSLMDVFKFLIFSLWLINIYLINVFITAQNFDEYISRQIIFADVIFSVSLATKCITKFGDENSLVNALIRIAKKVYINKSIGVLLIMLSGLIALGSGVYTASVGLSLSEFGGHDSNFYPGLFITLIMLVDTVLSIYAYYFNKSKPEISCNVKYREEKGMPTNCYYSEVGSYIINN